MKGKIKNHKLFGKTIGVMYPYKEKKFQFAKIKYHLSDYDNLNYQIIKFEDYEKFDKKYSHTLDVSEMLYDCKKNHKFKCKRMIFFDFDKNNNLLGIEIINTKGGKKNGR